MESPITADLIVQGAIGLTSVSIDGEDIYWIEMRPAERGRYAIVRRSPAGIEEEVLPTEMSARTRAHEYGGGAYSVDNGPTVFSNFSDQRLYITRRGGQPQALTHQGDQRYADMIFDDVRERLICVREDHTEADNKPTNGHKRANR
jgi:hypothetical protein